MFRAERKVGASLRRQIADELGVRRRHLQIRMEEEGTMVPLNEVVDSDPLEVVIFENKYTPAGDPKDGENKEEAEGEELEESCNIEMANMGHTTW